MPGPHHTSSHRFHPDEILWPGENHTIGDQQDRKSTRLNSSHTVISYAVFCLKKKSNAHKLSAPNANAKNRCAPHDNLIRRYDSSAYRNTSATSTLISHISSTAENQIQLSKYA